MGFSIRHLAAFDSCENITLGDGLSKPLVNRCDSTRKLRNDLRLPIGVEGDAARNSDFLHQGTRQCSRSFNSRRGDLQLSDSGLLTTGDGHPVLGDSGPITLPPADSMRIAEDGTIWIVPPGGDPGQPQQVDRLKLVSPAGSQIVKGVDNLFRVPNGGALPSDPAARLTAGSLEGSNVESSQALIDMIQASRAWDTQLKLISTARDMDTAATDLMRLPG